MTGKLFPFILPVIGFLLAACAASPTPAPLLMLAQTPQMIEAFPTVAPSDTPGVPPAVMQPTPSPPVTPAPSFPSTYRVTDGGCCNGPFWSSDNQKVLYLDRPSPDAMAGIWGIDRGGGSPMLITDRMGVFSADLSLRAFPAQGQTVVERLADGSRWIIPNGGRAVSFSRDGTQLVWTSGQSGPPFDSAQRQIWISNFDGSNPRKIHELLSGSVIGWYPDGRLLVSGRLSAPESGQAIWALTPPTQETETTQVKELARGQRLRAASLSPDGAWLAYVVTFSDDPAQDGLWLLNTNNLERRKLELFGSYRWRDGSRLLIVPLDLSQSASHRLWQMNAVSGQITPLTDPEHTPFKIANGDWSVSPDGSSIAYVSAQDQNIWVINLPSP